MKAARALWSMLLAVMLVACAAVLGLRTEARKPFEHRGHVLKGVNCVQCHRDTKQAQTFDGAMHIPETDECVDCHETPHNPATCSNCHGSPQLRTAARLAREHLKFNHDKHVDAAEGNCVKCHIEVTAQDGPLRPTMPSCFGCHQHEKQWETNDCDGCHVDLQMEHTLPQSHVVHGADWLREHGVRAASEAALCSACHTERTCAACHGANVPALPTRLRFDQPERADMHRAGFAARHALEARADQALCVTCHTESSCRGCHEREGVGVGSGRSPHPSGWVGLPGQSNTHGREARFDPISCASCHSGPGEQLCVGCHRVGAAGGNPHPVGFRSQRSFDELPCRLCHAGAL
jgi:hypothetical protein